MKKYHYTYWLSAAPNENYIGVRSCKCKPEDDTDYMSSSKIVKQMIAAGKKFHKHILKVWPTRKEAMEHEILMHRVLDVANNDLFLNQARQTSTRFSCSIPHTPETRAKMSATHTGMKRSPEARAIMSAAQKGRKISDEHRAKISAANTGKHHTPETCAKMSATRKGMRHTPESCAKMSAAAKGRKISDKQRASISKTLTGRKLSDEHRANITAGNIWRYKKKALQEQIEKIDKILKQGDLYYV